MKHLADTALAGIDVYNLPPDHARPFIWMPIAVPGHERRVADVTE